MNSIGAVIDGIMAAGLLFTFAETAGWNELISSGLTIVMQVVFIVYFTARIYWVFVLKENGGSWKKFWRRWFGMYFNPEIKDKDEREEG